MVKEARAQRIASYVADWPKEKVVAFQQDFLAWYDEEKRHLPWRQSQDPYRIWVSEIMLQQTQVATVIPYFERFMAWFPTIADLAAAPEDQLLKAWEGLGYYSRVRNMQFAAQTIMEEYDGEMPRDLKSLLALKGIGPYTAGAIASIAFNQPEPAVDGNVMRVFSRLFGITEDIAKPSTRFIFEGVVRHTISPQHPSEFNQAIMDLGATICTPTSPKCEACPLAAYCLAYQMDESEKYPIKSKKTKVIPHYYLALAMQDAEGRWYLEQRPTTGLLANFWTFPLVTLDKKSYTRFKQQWEDAQTRDAGEQILELVAEDEPSLVEYLTEEVANVIWQKEAVGEIQHVFSHQKWHVLIAYGYQAEVGRDETGWYYPTAWSALPFPKPQQKIVEILQKQKYIED